MGAGGRTDRHAGADGRFSQLEKAHKIGTDSEREQKSRGILYRTLCL